MIEPFEGGSGTSRLRHAIKQLGHNRDVDIELATVTSALPDIRIKIDHMPYELDADDLTICEHLREHKREVTINGGEVVEMTIKSPLKAGDRVVVASHDITQRFVIIDRI